MSFPISAFKIMHALLPFNLFWEAGRSPNPTSRVYIHTGQFILLVLEKRYDERPLGGVRKVRAQMLSVVHTWDQKACSVGRWLTVLSLSLMSPQASEMRLKHPISSLPLPKKRRGEDGPSSLGRLYLQPFAPKGGRGKLRIFYEESHFPRVPPSIPPLFSLKMNLPKKGP